MPFISHLRSIFLDATACCTRCGTVSRIFIRPPPQRSFSLSILFFFSFSFFSSSSSFSPPPPPLPSSSFPSLRSHSLLFTTGTRASSLPQLSSSNNAFFFHETFFVSRLHVLHPRLCTRIKTQPTAKGGMEWGEGGGRREGGRSRSRKKEHSLRGGGVAGEGYARLHNRIHV